MLPVAKIQLLTTKPHWREKMSVNLPLKGWVAPCPIRYAVASHAKSESELNSVEIGAANVAIIVPSESFLVSARVVGTTLDGPACRIV